MSRSRTVVERDALHALRFGDAGHAVTLYESVLAALPVADLAGQATVLCRLAGALSILGNDYPRACALLTHGYRLARLSGDGNAINRCAVAYAFGFHMPRGDFAAARAVLDETVAAVAPADRPQAWLQHVQAIHDVLSLFSGGLKPPSLAYKRSVLGEHLFVNQVTRLTDAMTALAQGAPHDARALLTDMETDGIPAQLRLWYLRACLLLAMQRDDTAAADHLALKIMHCIQETGDGMYAVECWLAIAMWSIRHGDFARGHSVLAHVLEVCRTRHFEFWEMKARIMLAYCIREEGRVQNLSLHLGYALKLSRRDSYGHVWRGELAHYAVPMLEYAVQNDIDAGQARALLGSSPCLVVSALSVKISVLGKLTVWVQGRPTRLSTQMRILLTMLVLRYGRVVETDGLVRALWPHENASSTKMRTRLRNAVCRLRQILQPHAAAEESCIEGRSSGYCLQVGGPLWLDLAELDAWMRDGARHRRNGKPMEAARCFEQAVALYKGPLDGEAVEGFDARRKGIERRVRAARRSPCSSVAGGCLPA